MTPAFLTKLLIGAFALALSIMTPAFGQDVMSLQVTIPGSDQRQRFGRMATYIFRVSH